MMSGGMGVQGGMGMVLEAVFLILDITCSLMLHFQGQNPMMGGMGMQGGMGMVRRSYIVNCLSAHLP